MESKFIVTAYVEANSEMEAREVLHQGNIDKMSIFSVEKLIEDKTSTDDAEFDPPGSEEGGGRR